ncbi:hypothetical protein AMECASPLE_035062 [Ameca splendens]|uniref:Uncharacterized protein n=1 Tax=Ameca splendens TaxID=208324 RepID=A0ABV0YUC8_9TELE
MHGKNMQTPCRKTPGWELNPGPSCCKAKWWRSTSTQVLTSTCQGITSFLADWQQQVRQGNIFSHMRTLTGSPHHPEQHRVNWITFGS